MHCTVKSKMTHLIFTQCGKKNFNSQNFHLKISLLLSNETLIMMDANFRQFGIVKSRMTNLIFTQCAVKDFNSQNFELTYNKFSVYK